jgi:hypothetical protein
LFDQDLSSWLHIVTHCPGARSRHHDSDQGISGYFPAVRMTNPVIV